MILSDFFKALGQIGDRRFRWVLIQGVLLAIGLLVVLIFGFGFLINTFVPDSFTVPFFGSVTFISSAILWISTAGLLFGSIFLMMPVASLFTGLFLDKVADAVEEVHYPALSRPAPKSIRAAITESVRFLGLMILVNLCALIIYFGSAFFAPLVFWLVNGFLLGREYSQMVATRHLSAPDAQVFLRQHRIATTIAGTLMAIPLSIPIVNLVVPVLGVATFTHQFHRLNKRR
jgi:CysZ protein